MTWNEMLKQAHEKTKQFDIIDAQHGAMRPAQIGNFEIARTAQAALHTAFTNKSWDIVAEAFVLLEDIK